MSHIEIRQVRSKADMRRFILFPWSLYRVRERKGFRYPNWVPPLVIDEFHSMDRSKNSWFLQGEQQEFVAYKDGMPVGRIAAHIDHGYVHFQEDKAGFFGFFESSDDPEVAASLCGAAETWIRAKGLKAVIGPVNQNTNRILGCLIEGFEYPPVLYMGWNPPYYDALLNAAGYTKTKDLVSYRMDTSLKLSEKIVRVAELCRKREGVSIRSIDMKREFPLLVETIRDIYNSAWADRWGFVPWTKEQFEQLAEDLKLVLDEKLVLIAESDGESVAFALPIPDVNQIFIRMNGRLFPSGLPRLLMGRSSIDTLRVVAFGVKATHRNKGIDALFVHELYMRALELGYTRADFSWILEDNTDLRNMLENWGAQTYKRHRVYRKELA